MDREIDIGVRRRARIRRVVAVLVPIAAAAVLVVFAAEWLRPSIKSSRARFGRVERGDLEATLTASGEVLPAHERVISCPVDARVERVLRRPGEVVEPGSEILELDTSAVRLRLKKLEEQLSQNRNDRLQRRLELEETVSALDSRIESKRLDLEIARFRREQKDKLRQDGLIAEEEFKEAEVALKKTELELRRLEEEVVSQRRLNEARLERLELDASILRGERDEVRRQLELATTRAPVAGVLTSVFEEEGATLRPGDVLARIADLESFRVEARISDAYASRLQVGQPARVLVDDERLTGRVSGVQPAVADGTIGFEVALDDPSHALLRPNLRVDVLVVTGHRAGVLTVPRGPYIRGGGDRHRVFVVSDGGDRAVRTDVTLGLTGHRYYEVLDGLKEGDRIVVSDVRDYLHAPVVRIK